MIKKTVHLFFSLARFGRNAPIRRTDCFVVGTIREKISGRGFLEKRKSRILFFWCYLFSVWVIVSESWSRFAQRPPTKSQLLSKSNSVPREGKGSCNILG